MPRQAKGRQVTCRPPDHLREWMEAYARQPGMGTAGRSDVMVALMLLGQEAAESEPERLATLVKNM